MRRADRLFQIIQFLRARSTATAAEIARALEVAPRTIYRDLADLKSNGVPIDGEAGVGYAMRAGFDLPPLMFTRSELEALVLGARMVAAWSDPELARAANSVIDKVKGVLPAPRRGEADRIELFVPDFWIRGDAKAHLADLRVAMRDRKKVRLSYRDAGGQESRRTVRPIALTFWGTSWTITGWCELRKDFRSFRPERIAQLKVTAQRYADEPGKDLATFLERMEEQRRDRPTAQ